MLVEPESTSCVRCFSGLSSGSGFDSLGANPPPLRTPAGLCISANEIASSPDNMTAAPHLTSCTCSLEHARPAAPAHRTGRARADFHARAINHRGEAPAKTSRHQSRDRNHSRKHTREHDYGPQDAGLSCRRSRGWEHRLPSPGHCCCAHDD